MAGGADAVYVGLRHFNARGRAENFRQDDLPRQVAYLHRHGLRCYVVFNTLLHDDELAKAVPMAERCLHAGVDALIIQDLGLWRVLARHLPDLPRHASTQMTVHDPQQIRVLADLGAERVILARELALPEIEACTRVGDALGVETEHFVHGALCYAFSGQCLMSNFAGCRSANRGTCAQNCRFDYQLDQTGQQTTAISMRDLALIGRIPDLARIGVASFKIEGRLKEPAYVYTTSRIYRAAVDAWAAGRAFDPAAAEQELRAVFARPFTATPVQGRYDRDARLSRWDPAQDRVSDTTIRKIDRRRGLVWLQGPRPQPGWGFDFTIDDFNGGFLVTAVDREGDDWRCRVRLDERGPHLPSGHPVFRNADHAAKQKADSAMAAVRLDAFSAGGMAMDLQVRGEAGQPLQVEAVVVDGRRARASSEQPLQQATGRPLDAGQLQRTLGAFGGSGYMLRDIEVALQGSLFLPAAQLKALRRQLVVELDRSSPPQAASWDLPAVATVASRTTKVWAAVESLAAAEAAFSAGADAVWLDDPRLDLWQDQPPDLPVLPRLWLRHPAVVAVSPHLGALGLPLVAGQIGVIRAAQEAGLPVVADHFCNVTNIETIDALHDLGAEAVTISLECSAREVARLAGRYRGDARLALCVHGRLPSMLTRQDHGLAPGSVRTMQAADHDGGLPYAVQRRAGAVTTIHEARTLCAPHEAALTAGIVDAWLLELGGAAVADVAATVAGYVALAGGRGDPDQLLAQVRAASPHGCFPGHLATGSRALDAVRG